MLYFLPMGRKKNSIPQKKLVDVFAMILLIPILFLKWLGDAVVGIGILFFSVFSKPYNFFKITSKQFSVFKIYESLPHLKSRKKKDVILKKFFHGIVSLLNRKIYLPGFHLRVVFRHRIPPSIRLLIIKIKFFLLGAIVVFIVAFVYQAQVWVKMLPNPSYLRLRDIEATTKIYDRNGKLLYEIYAEQNRTPVSLNNIPQVVQKATIAIEDKEFFNHKGFSLRGILRAVIHNLTTSSLEGGSTITQQLVRSALLTSEKTWQRKVKEIFLSVWTEQVYTKEQILEMYFNQVPYGGTAWGIQAASQTYFGKNVSELNLAQASLLAGLPSAPSLYSPFGNYPELTRIRQEEVLQKMRETGFISEEEREIALSTPLTLRIPRIPILAPHFVMYVKNQLEQQFGHRMVEKGGLRVYTTLDLSIQEMAEKVVSSQIEKLRNYRVGNAGVLVSSPSTGEILAMVGSLDYFDKKRQGNVNVTTALRQPGSSVKVITYATALQSGYTPASLLDDSPVSFRTPGLASYTPINYDGKFHGIVPLRTALASSYNIPAVKVLASIGLPAMIDQAKRLGITTWENDGRFGLSLTLGGGEVTMLNMATAYGTFANGGSRVDTAALQKISTWQGEDLPLPAQRKVMDAVPASVAYIITSILSDNAARTPAFGSSSALVISGKTVAVKTGTSDNKRDNWTIGYTPDYVVTVWVGNNDNSPMHPTLTSGVTGAAPIWNEIFSNILKDKEDKPFAVPSDIISLPCYGKIEYFIQGTQPKGGCPKIITPTPTPGSEL